MELKVDQDKCLGCGVCVIACPKTTETIMMVENGFIKLFSVDKCDKCGTCQMFCPTEAIWLE